MIRDYDLDLEVVCYLLITHIKYCAFFCNSNILCCIIVTKAINIYVNYNIKIMTLNNMYVTLTLPSKYPLGRPLDILSCSFLLKNINAHFVL